MRLDRLWLVRFLPLALLLIIYIFGVPSSLLLLPSLLLIFLTTAFPYLLDFFLWDMGESTFLYNGKQMKEGKKLYRNLYENKPPLIHLIANVIARTKSEPEEMARIARLLNVLVHCLVITILYIIASAWFGAEAGIFASILYILAASHPSWPVMSLITENFVALFTLSAIGMVAINSSHPLLVVTSGVIFSLALLSKQTAIFSLPAFAVVLLYKFEMTWTFLLSLTLFGVSGIIATLFILSVLSSANLIDIKAMLSLKTLGSRVSPRSALSLTDFVRILGGLCLMNLCILSFVVVGVSDVLLHGAFLTSLNLKFLSLFWTLSIVFLQFIASPPFNYTLFPSIVPSSLFASVVLVGMEATIGTLLLAFLLPIDVYFYRYKYRKELNRVQEHINDIKQLKGFLSNTLSSKDSVFVYPGGSDVYLSCKLESPSIVSYHCFHTPLVLPDLYDREFEDVSKSRIFIVDLSELKSLRNHLRLNSPLVYKRVVKFMKRMLRLYSYSNTFGRYQVWIKS